MPELPDLQVFAKNLKKRVLHKKIEEVEFHNMMRTNELKEDIHRALVGQSIRDINRIGKELVFSLDNDYKFSVHLMLNGKFTIGTRSEVPKLNYKIISLDFADDSALTVSDYKSMCKITFQPQITDVPDVFSKEFTKEYFLKAANRYKRMNVKAFLINQKIMKGIGNAYADEILYDADLSPTSITGKIPEERLLGLYASISHVLEEAIQKIEEMSPDIISGEERSFLKVHNTKLRATAEGEPIKVRTIASKITYYTAKQDVFL